MANNTQNRVRFPCYIQVKMTAKDKELIEAEAKRRESTTSEIIREFIRTLDKDNKD